MLEAYTNYGTEKAMKVGMNLMESVDNLALEAGLKGSLQLVAAGMARTTLDAGTATHRASDTLLWRISSRLQELNVPGFISDLTGDVTWSDITHPASVADLITNSGGNVVNVAQYQKGEMILNQEIGRLGPFKIVSSGNAKVFFGVGAANSSDVDTTLAAAATALSKTIVVTINTNIAAGDMLNIIAAKETSTTFYPMNERVRVASVSGTTITIVGAGDNGGLRFDHASGVVVNADDAVYTHLLGGPKSICKVYAPSMGVFGTMVGPLKQGLLEQWESLGWKYFGGYGRGPEKWLYRLEVSSADEA
jgi:hypothetical protein